MMLRVIFFSFISIVGMGLIIFLYILFFLPTLDTKIKIDKNEISKKLNSNQTILIPTEFEVKNVYLIDDGLLSPHIEVHLSNEINISIHSSNYLDYEGEKNVRTKILNSLKVREYQTKDRRVIYIFKDGQLNCFYEFYETFRRSIDEYLLKKVGLNNKNQGFNPWLKHLS
ncbi:hypothetical protein BED47_07505 [Gottfriedia luciferensis]|uniref:Uncharacterized protein n=1 Tax=Gottfriedia luciferensis TaxID=178774 RepID=A0ABX2ZP27_9BACI|nr:hypothetical protein [Gottfriedia luciferensis]ODG91491.1 hypothetical protein BED47_07505 [Gottfriedia luciferensis]